MSATGSSDTRLILIRGNSGSGKSTLAAAIRAARPRGVAVIGQDHLRREVLHVRDTVGSPAAEYIAMSARFALDHGLHTVIEGILYEPLYGDVLRDLIADHLGVTRCYRFVLPFDETLRRHAGKPNAAEFGETELRKWWRDDDPLNGVHEHRLDVGDTVPRTVARIVTDCGWDAIGVTPVDRSPRPSSNDVPERRS